MHQFWVTLRRAPHVSSSLRPKTLLFTQVQSDLIQQRCFSVRCSRVFKSHPNQSLRRSNHLGWSVISRRQMWIPPPAVLRMILRPAVVLIATFLGGVALQYFNSLMSRSGPQFIASPETQRREAELVARMRKVRMTALGVLCVILLYSTRGTNPLYPMLFGSESQELTLAKQNSSKPMCYHWNDSLTALESMKNRLKSMEKHLNRYESTVSESASQADSVRLKGYSNGIEIALMRADHWLKSGESDRIRECLALATEWSGQIGGRMPDGSLQRISEIKSKDLSRLCHSQLTLAHTASLSGDVAGVTDHLSQIRHLMDSQREIHDHPPPVSEEQMASVLSRARQRHYQNMIAECSELRRLGANRKADALQTDAEAYAIQHGVTLDPGS